MNVWSRGGVESAATERAQTVREEEKGQHPSLRELLTILSE